MNLLLGWWKEIAFVGVIILAFAAGWHYRDLQADVEYNKQIMVGLQSTHDSEDNADKQGEKYEAIYAKINEDVYTLRQNMRSTYVDDAYRCLIPADGLRLLADAAIVHR